MKVENTNYVRYLIERAKEGRKRAFQDLCEINLKTIFSLAYKLLADSKAAEKITIKTFFDAWDGINSYNPEIPYSGWVKKFAIKNSIAALENEIVVPVKSLTKADFNSESDFLQNLILSLPVNGRIIFVLHDVEGYSIEEIKTFLKSLGHDEIKTILINTRDFLLSKI